MKAARATALEELARHVAQTWETYGVPTRALKAPMLAPAQRTVAPKWAKGPITWRTEGAVVLETTRSLGVTLEQYLASKRDAVKSARTPEKLALALAKAKDAALSSALYLWARGEARGPNTPDNLLRIAKKAESLAQFLDKRGDEDAADRQRARAAGLRASIAPELEPMAAMTPTSAAPVVSLTAHREKSRSAAARAAWNTIRARRAAAQQNGA